MGLTPPPGQLGSLEEYRDRRGRALRQREASGRSQLLPLQQEGGLPLTGLLGLGRHPQESPRPSLALPYVKHPPFVRIQHKPTSDSLGNMRRAKPRKPRLRCQWKSLPAQLSRKWSHLASSYTGVTINTSCYGLGASHTKFMVMALIL